MRMWMVDPKKLCDRHLLGEHVETHMFVGHIKKRKSLRGYLEKGLVEIHNIYWRHKDLAKEMERRGFKHNSPLDFSYPYEEGRVNVKENVKELCNRCERCRKRFKEGAKNV